MSRQSLPAGMFTVTDIKPKFDPTACSGASST
jgi:hypothetical protein